MATRPTRHHDEKPSETLVRFIAEHTLGVRVCCYDDRIKNGAPDAIVHRNGGVPLEIVSDPLQSDVQLLSALDKIGRRAQFAGLSSGYMVSLTTKARIKDLGWLEKLLHQLEHPGLRDLVPRHDDTYEFIEPHEDLRPGEVVLTSGSSGGRPLPSPSGVVEAAAAVLDQRAYADVARKLDAYGGSERHAVLIVDDENDSTFSWLREATPADIDQLPAPQVAPEITHFWITPRYVNGLTIVWSADAGWQGTVWGAGDPFVALETWDDPACPDDHRPGAGTAG